MIETPIFVKTYDFTLWLFNTTAKFPKHLRHSLTERIEKEILDFTAHLIRANRTRGRQRQSSLGDADCSLEILRMSVRMSKDLKVLSERRYGFAAEKMEELGRLLGGWIKQSSVGKGERSK
ncbi:diversity-generating retroelement protein Avd [Candidatus Hydrogenedentota bacterium]